MTFIFDTAIYSDPEKLCKHRGQWLFFYI